MVHFVTGGVDALQADDVIVGGVEVNRVTAVADVDVKVDVVLKLVGNVGHGA